MSAGSPEPYILNINGARLDIRPYFFVALSSDVRSRKYIQDKYNKHKWTYFSRYQKSVYKDHPLLNCYPYEVEKSIRMVIGIFEESEETGKDDVLMSIIKFAFNDLYRFIERNKGFDEETYKNRYRNRTKADMMNAHIYIHSMYVAMFICFKKKANMGIDMDTALAMIGMNDTPNTPDERVRMWNENENFVQEKVKILKEQHYLDSFKPGTSIWEMYAQERKTVEEALSKNPDATSDFSEQVKLRVHNMIFYGDVLEAVGIDPIELQMKPVSEVEMRNVLVEFTRMVDEYPDCGLNFNQAFPAIYYIRQLAQMYNHLKYELLDTSEEEKFVVVLDKQRAIQHKESELKRLEEKLHKREELLKQKLIAAEEQVKELTRQNKVLEAQLSELKPLQKEVAGIRTMLYQNEQTSRYKEVPIVEKREQIQDDRVVFFGGHPNWIQKMKEEFPNSRFIDVDDINRKLSFIASFDIVCINADYFNHGFYEKLMREVAKHSIKLVYLQGSTNPERVVETIYERIKE